MQKAGIVDLIKSRTNDMTLAIGDGELFQLMKLKVQLSFWTNFYNPDFFLKFHFIIHVRSLLFCLRTTFKSGWSISDLFLKD